MDFKTKVKDIIKWALENENNKKKVIKAATLIIGILNSINRKLDEEDLDHIVGGLNNDIGFGKDNNFDIS